MGGAEQPPLRRRVLIVSADIGGGHDATGRALEEEVGRLWPGSQVCWVDTLDVMGRYMGPFSRGAYRMNIEHTPWLYQFFYASLWRKAWFAAASKAFVGRWAGSRLAAVIEDFNPDLILSTYPLGSAGLSWLRSHRGLGVTTGAWVSDFAPHPFWVYGDLDLTFVVHDAAVPLAVAAQPAVKVAVVAPPVVQRFQPGPAEPARAAFGLAQDRFIAVVSCGSYGFGHVAQTAANLLDADDRVQVVVVCGRNRGLLRELEGMDDRSGRLTVYGWVDDMATLLRAANVLVTNGGGATVLEAMATSTPIVMYRPIAAHGEANSMLMTMAGVAWTCWDSAQLVGVVRAMLRQSGVWPAPAPTNVPEAAPMESPAEAPAKAAGLGVAELASSPRAPVRSGWPMRSADEFFLHVDLPESPQHVGAVLRLGPVEGRGELTEADVMNAMRHQLTAMPAFRRRISRRGSTPRWIETTNVDLSAHVSVQQLTNEEGSADFRSQESAALDQFWSQPLPENRPPWQVLVLAGMPGGHSTVAIKLHHAMGDGVSALGLLRQVTSTDTRPVNAGLSRSRIGPPDRPLAARVRLGRSVVRGLWRLARAGRAPADPLNRPMASAERRLLLVELPAERVARAARKCRARSSELIVAVVAQALAQALPGPARPSLRAMVPVTAGRGRYSRAQGNRTGAVALDLPTGEMPLRERVARIRDMLRDSLSAGEPAAAGAVMRLMGTLPAPVHRMMARHVYTSRHFNVIVSYLPAVARVGSFAGAPVHSFFPVVALASDVPVGVAAGRWADVVGVSILVDASLADQLSQWRKALFEALEEADPGGETAPATVPAAKARDTAW